MRIDIVFITFFSMVYCCLQAQQPMRKDSAATPEKDEDRVFIKVEVSGGYPGGQVAWKRYLEKELVYPRRARRKRIEGAVEIKFIVTRDGMVTDVTPLSGDSLLVPEAVRLVKNSGRWDPMLQGGRTVKSYRKEVIQFKLN